METTTYINKLLEQPMCNLNRYENALCRVLLDYHTIIYSPLPRKAIVGYIDIDALAELVYQKSKELRKSNE